MSLDYKRWNNLLQGLSISDDSATFDALNTAYSEGHRKYHNHVHLLDCLEQFDEVSTIVEHPHEIEAALWFHDAIYKTRSSNNEMKSAQWSTKFLQKHHLSVDVIERVRLNILATRHDKPPNTIDEQLVVDIDLSILGKTADQYEAFEQCIRQEYSWVPWIIYRRKRTAILNSFLSRKRIYYTGWFSHKYEVQAKLNLKRAIERLQSNNQQGIINTKRNEL